LGISYRNPICLLVQILCPDEILQTAEFVFSLLLKVKNVEYVLPRVVVDFDVVVEVDRLLAEVKPGVAAHEAIVLLVRCCVK
jgi:hypothetical protein